MEQTKAFFSALEEWKEETGAKINDYVTLLFMISYALGGEEKERSVFDESEQPDLIRERIEELVNNQGMQEDFLISSLVKLVDERLEHQIMDLGNAIAFHLETMKIEKLKETSEKMLNRFTAPNFTLYAEEELESWRKITIEKLGASSRRQWNADRLLARPNK